MGLSTPYYVDKEAGIALYHGDCREYIDLIPRQRIQLVLTDPPYGIDADPQKFDKHSTFKKVADDDKDYDPTFLLEKCPRVVLWGANNFIRHLDSRFVPKDYQPTGGWLVWDKTINNNVQVKISHGEIAWTNCFRGIRIYRHLWSGGYRASEPGFHVHPTQKPVVLMKWCLEQFTELGDLVLDPYMGSGPVAQACLELGRKYIGIELEEEYCEIARKRLNTQYLFTG